MHLEWSDEQRAVMETTRAFVHRELVPHEDEVERTGRLDPELVCSGLLTGHRGAQGTDLDALVATVARVVEIAVDTQGLVSLEINPMIVTTGGGWACDALVTVMEESG